MHLVQGMHPRDPTTIVQIGISYFATAFTYPYPNRRLMDAAPDQSLQDAQIALLKQICTPMTDGTLVLSCLGMLQVITQVTTGYGPRSKSVLLGRSVKMFQVLTKNQELEHINCIRLQSLPHLMTLLQLQIAAVASWKTAVATLCEGARAEILWQSDHPCVKKRLRSESPMLMSGTQPHFVKCLFNAFLHFTSYPQVRVVRMSPNKGKRHSSWNENDTSCPS